MEWIFKAHQWNHVHPPCPEERVEELAKFLIKNKYEPFAWGIKENTIIQRKTGSIPFDKQSNIQPT